jgi:predicted ABC-type ATPase
LAGPNGSGKSTLAQRDIFARLTNTPEQRDPFIRLNADERAQELRSTRADISDDARALLAAQQTDEELDRLLSEGRSCLVETVLSSDKYIERVRAAKAGGYWIGLIYVLLQDPSLNVGRVAQRVCQGGHDVPEERVRARWARSLARLPLFAAAADAFAVWDNSYPDFPARLLIEALPDSYYLSPLCEALIEDGATARPLRDALIGVRHLLGA